MNGIMYPQYPGFGGVVPNQAQAPKVSNWLTPEKYALIQKGLNQFSLSVTAEEMAKGQCNHYKLDGTSALIPDQDGSGGCTCSICGTHFTSTEFALEDVKAATQNILDILNTIKIMYLSIDANAALEYFQIIPFIEKIPQLYNNAVADFKKYEGVQQFVPSNNMNPFNLYGAMIYGPQMYGMPVQQPFAAQPAAPQMPYGAQAPAYGQPVNPAFNPMYGAPVNATVPGYQPQATGYAFNPQGAAAPQMVNTNMPVQPQAAPAQEAPVKVDTEFKK